MFLFAAYFGPFPSFYGYMFPGGTPALGYFLGGYVPPGQREKRPGDEVAARDSKLAPRSKNKFP